MVQIIVRDKHNYALPGNRNPMVARVVLKEFVEGGQT